MVMVIHPMYLGGYPYHNVERMFGPNPISL